MKLNDLTPVKTVIVKNIQDPKGEDQFIIGLHINQPNRRVRFYKTPTNHLIAVSAILPNREQFILRKVLRNSIRYSTCVHSFKGVDTPLNQLMEVMFNESIPVSNGLKICEMHLSDDPMIDSGNHYLLTTTKKGETKITKFSDWE